MSVAVLRPLGNKIQFYTTRGNHIITTITAGETTIVVEEDSQIIETTVTTAATTVTMLIIIVITANGETVTTIEMYMITGPIMVI